MKKYLTIILVLLTGTLACGAEATSNVQACRAFVAKVKSLECIDTFGALDPNMICPAQLDLYGGDYTDYYQCIEDAYTCVADESDAEDEWDVDDDWGIEDERDTDNLEDAWDTNDVDDAWDTDDVDDAWDTDDVEDAWDTDDIAGCSAKIPMVNR